MCENKGHFAKMCEAKMTNEVKANGPNEVKVNEQQFLGELTSNTTESESESEIFIRSFQTQETSAKTITGRCRRGHLEK